MDSNFPTVTASSSLRQFDTTYQDQTLNTFISVHSFFFLCLLTIILITVTFIILSNLFYFVLFDSFQRLQ